MNAQFPLSTGQAARLLGATEPRTAELVRRGKVDPPPVIAGRRMWGPEHLRQAAEALGGPALEIVEHLPQRASR